MVFLNPFFLAGLGAAAIPIIIHFLNLRKTRTIEFSTLSFLKELQKTRIRRLKLRQLLLLILRTLIIIFIVIAFSRPAIQSGSGFIPAGTGRGVTAVILLDNSVSMDTYNRHGHVFRQAKAYARAVAEILSDARLAINTDAALLPQSDISDAAELSPTPDLIRLRSIIDETEIKYSHRLFGDGLSKAIEMFEGTLNINKELYIITDLQASHWKDNSGSGVTDSRYQHQTFIIPVVADGFENAAVHNIEFRSGLFEPGKPVTMDVEIRNYGVNALENHNVSVYLNGSREAQTSVNLPAGGSAVAEFTVVPDAAGIIEGIIELEDDDLIADNIYYFTLNIPEQIRVLLTANTHDDVRFIETALATRGVRSNTHSLSSNSAILTKYVPASGFAAENLNSYDVIIAVNVPSFNESQSDRIAGFVENGGGFILFPGDDADIVNYNNLLLNNLRLPLITGVTDVSGTMVGPGRSNGILLFDRVDYDHPIFEGIFQERLRERAAEPDRIESPRIFKSITTAEPSTADSRVIDMTGNRVFLLTGKRQLGTVILYGIHPGMSWSDFPVRGIFVPLIHRSVAYAASSDYNDDRYLAGDPVSVEVLAANINPDSEYILKHPDGVREHLRPDHISVTGRLQFRLNTVDSPGIYYIIQDNRPIKAFAANVHPSESTGDRLDELEIRNILEGYGFRDVHYIHGIDELSTAVVQSRYGIELWKFFAILALIAVIAETIIARGVRQNFQTERAGRE